jgi:2-polyprenyl-6-methoxyphenol hydroxylase-like FAD-dependent oxidoreductase
VVDKAAEPGTTSRALAVQVRTLELYRQLGLADHLIASGHKVPAVNLTIAGSDVARIPFTNLGEGVTPFPFALIYPQDEHERFLAERLADAGVAVERSVELVDFDDDGARVRARLARRDRPEETCDVAWLAGCDGAHSLVRHNLGFGFPGGTYTHVFYVADVQARGPMIDGELHVALDEADFLAVFPLAGEGRARLIGTVKHAGDDDHPAFTWDDVGKAILGRLRVDVERVNWFSTYRVHHRVTSNFRGGRAFLAGDAAHIHSPVGGQGMNTGIGDAINLAWKLAAVVRGDADARVLETYEPERIGFASSRS